MTIIALLLACQLGAADDLAPRVETLRFHLERLGAISVTADAETEKAAKLEGLKQDLDVGISSEDAFNDLYRKMDEVRTWLLAHSPEKPARAEGAFEDADAEWILKNPQLELRLRKDNLAMTVKTPAETWEYLPSDESDVKLADRGFSFASARSKTAEAFSPGYAVGATIHLADFPDVPGQAFDFTIHLLGNEIVFELSAPQDTQDLVEVNWPKAIRTANSPDVIAVIPHMQGMLLPGDWPQNIRQKEPSNSRTIYMPWWGILRSGRGVMTILETDDDAGVAYEHPSGGPTVIQPCLYSSLKRLRYLRTLRYVFDDDASYVEMAKRYRAFAKETGRFVSLDEKLIRTPNLAEVIGRPVIHLGALYHFVPESALFNKERIEANHALNTFDQLAQGLRDLKAKGLEDAYVHLDGWGFYGYDNAHPDVLPAGEEQGGWDGLRRFADTCDELGFLFAVHDQYRDFYKNAVSYDDRLALMRPDGSRPFESTWCGGPQSILSPRFAPEYVRRNHDLFAEKGVKVKGAYLDVFSVVPLEESHDPVHPVTRTDCARYRRQCFDLLRARGYVVSSEEPTDYLARSLDLVHHGPYATYERIGGGEARGIPVPLWNLVYHDSLLLPWEMGEDGGWGIPKGDAGWLHCLLNAGMPYVGIGASSEALERVKEACALNQRLARQEMVNHEFLSADRRQQRATYADGTSVTVNFDTKEYRIETP